MRRCALLFAFLFCIVSFLPNTASSQAVYGSIFGTVTDPSGAAVPNAKVTITNIGKATSTTTTTNETGNYTVTHLIPDQYSVKVEAQGFKTAEQKPIVVNADQGSKVDMPLQLGQVTEAVEVTGEAPQLKTDRADVATTLNSRYVEQLPILNRNFQSLLLLTPGTQLLTGWNHAATENPQGSQQIYVNGQHFSGTAYELDGTDNQDPILGIIVVNPNVDAVTETKVDLQNYDAEFGKAVAGVMTVQTKSGTNEFHGSGFWFRRSDAEQARDPFTQYQKDPITGRFIPPTRWNQFGGTIGGPIIKDKLFFFGDYQGTRQTTGATSLLTVPTAQLINTCTGAGDGSGFCKLDQYVPFIGNGSGPTSLIYDPATGDQTTGAGRTPFCGPLGCAAQPNWIPMTAAAAIATGHPATSVVSPISQKILSLFPAPTSGSVTNNYVFSGAGPFNQNQFDTRIDYNASQSLQVFGRFSLAYYSLSGSPALGPELGGVGDGLSGLSGSSINHDYSLAAGFTKTISSTLLTDFRFGWFKYNPVTSKPDAGVNAAENLGIPGLNITDQGALTQMFTSGLPLFNNVGPAINAGSDQSQNAFGDGLNVGRCNCPLIESEQQFQFVNNWTKIKGNHQLKFGLDMRYAMNLRVPSDANRTGQLNFTNALTSDAGTGGAGIGSFLLGDVNNMSRFVSTSLTAAERQKRFFYYGQDTWRVTPKFTLNYGLRWEIYFPESVNGKDNGGFANPVEGIIRIAGEGPYGTNGNIGNTWKAFAPRLGVAYQVTPKTVVRMGYGRSFDIGVFGSNFGHAVTQNLPVLLNQQIFPQNVANVNYFPAFNLASGPPGGYPPTVVTPAELQGGFLPLGGPNNNVQPRMRPLTQVLPTLDAWNATVQRQLTNTMTLEVGYVGNKGTHVFAGNGPAYDMNIVPLGPGTALMTASGPQFQATVPAEQRRPFYNHFTYPTFLVPGPTPGSLVPMTCCGDGIMGNYFGNDASSNYNALQVRVDKRFSQGLQFQSTYTYSHANNWSTDGGFPYGSIPDRHFSYGPDDFNRKNVWINNIVYELPFGRGKTFLGGAGRALDLVVGGWQLTTTMNWSSGLPWTPTVGECGFINDTGDPCMPNVSGSFHMGAGSLDPQSHTVTYFTPVPSLSYGTPALGTNTCDLARPTSGSFALPACGTIGNAGRNSYWGPSAFTDDMSIAKNFKITERFNAQFRMDAFNIFNHPVLDFSSQDFSATGGTCVDCGGTNGQIKDIQFGTTMRTLQFGLKLMF